MKKQNLMIPPLKIYSQNKDEHGKKFIRKPYQKSQRSLSKRSLNSSFKQIYIKKNSVDNSGEKIQQEDFVTSMLNSVLAETIKNQKKYENLGKLTQRKCSFRDKQMRDYGKTQPKNKRMISTVGEMQLKDQEIKKISGEMARLKKSIEEQINKRKKIQNEKKQIFEQLKQATKVHRNAQVQYRKLSKQKQYLLKQIQFLQKISYDQKTSLMQSYRQKYLQIELQKIRKQLNKQKTQRQNQLQNQIKTLKQQQFSIQSHYKAMKVANQCLIKQITYTRSNLHDIVLNSKQYKKLKDKYTRFLQEYRSIRNQCRLLKAQIKNSRTNEQDDLFNLTISQIQIQRSVLRQSGNIHQNNPISVMNYCNKLSEQQQNNIQLKPKTTLMGSRYRDELSSYKQNKRFL